MSFSIPTWLKQDDDLMLGDRPGSSDWFALSDEVGRGRINHRRDVIKVESLLNQAGLFDLERLDGPWGYANERLDAPIKAYQKLNGLKVDGFMRPDGETINRFRQDYGDTFAEYPAPTPAMADAHHALREKGEDGLLVDRWPELKINPHPRLDPLAAKAGFDEWNESWAKHAASANGSFDGIPAELKKYVDQDPVRGIMQARDMTQRWDALRPGEGNKFARAMLQALDGKPEYQSAYLASEIPQGLPIGTPRADAAQRYAAMVEEGRAERATDAQQVAQAPAEKGTEIAQAKPPLEEMSDADLEIEFRNRSRNTDWAGSNLRKQSSELRKITAAREAILDGMDKRIVEAVVGGGIAGAIDENAKGALKDALGKSKTTIYAIVARTFKAAPPAAVERLAEELVKASIELSELRDKETAAADGVKTAIEINNERNAERDAVWREIDRRQRNRKAPGQAP